MFGAKVETNAFEVFKCVQLRTETAMNAEELLVHHSGEGQGAEGLHARIVHRFRVLVLAFEFEGEVVGKMSTFVVAPQQPQSVGVPDLERPQIQNALVSVSTATPLRTLGLLKQNRPLY